MCFLFDLSPKLRKLMGKVAELNVDAFDDAECEGPRYDREQRQVYGEMGPRDIP